MHGEDVIFILTMTIIITYGLLPGPILKYLLRLSIETESHRARADTWLSPNQAFLKETLTF